MSEQAFWAEEIAKKVKDRKIFFFTDSKVPKAGKCTVKSSSSLSGVLHIGRLSDLIRGEAVSRALDSLGLDSEFIYVTEDMDPLRKVPKGVPESFYDYIGVPVSDVPDPFGCHGSYAEHFVSAFFEVMEDFLFLKPKVFSMRAEYKKGSFNKAIETILKNSDKVKAIIESKQDSSLPEEWSPWKPICEKCGKLQTTVITGVDGAGVSYKCQDYAFEKNVAKGCGFEGQSDLRKANGKLVWKSEWAAQWQHWNVCSEGAGKEYESRNSAFWVNAEICEKVLGFPMPVPIFYEHLMVEGKKMSASLGNVVYPKDWEEVARPEALKYLYMKRIMKSRSFSWRDIPNLELELDRAILEPENKLVVYSAIKGRALVSLPVDYATIASLVQLFPDSKELVSALQNAGLFPKKPSRDELFALRERIEKAALWVEKYAPPEQRLAFLESLSQAESEKIASEVKPVLVSLSQKLSKIGNADEMQQAIFAAAKESGVNPRSVFKAIYLALTGKESGPRAGLLILALGKDRALRRLKEAGS
jgi:lysyl-tRNA synthetase class 1